jgi:hypothetical protein
VNETIGRKRLHEKPPATFAGGGSHLEQSGKCKGGVRFFAVQAFNQINLTPLDCSGEKMSHADP